MSAGGGFVNDPRREGLQPTGPRFPGDTGIGGGGPNREPPQMGPYSGPGTGGGSIEMRKPLTLPPWAAGFGGKPKPGLRRTPEGPPPMGQARPPMKPQGPRRTLPPWTRREGY
jgi:hypothetical protein